MQAGRRRTALVLVAIAVGVSLLVTDVRGHSEANRAVDAAAAGHVRLAHVRAGLARDAAQLQVSNDQVRSLESTAAQDRATLGTTNAAISTTERGLFYGGYDIAALDTCLGGVTQALDQAAVGQTAGALSSLGSVSSSCNAAKPTGS